jgi:hypothetical protein
MMAECPVLKVKQSYAGSTVERLLTAAAFVQELKPE